MSFKIRLVSRLALLMLLIGCIFLASNLEGEEDNVIYVPSIARTNYFGDSDEWPTVAANPARTSWVPDEVTGNLSLNWYRPIEAYIPQNSQVIAANGLLYISTARGLYALDAFDGEVAWRFDTELPLGNSPTVSDGVVYVGGYDRKLHALDAISGAQLWAFTGAKAGFDTNPLVVDGKVIAGNRDGNMYAIGTDNSANRGQLLWQYETGGAIHLSAAYNDGVVYFASNDNYAYALNADTGALVWRSAMLPGMQFQSYWPVIFQDKVIFSAAPGYVGNFLAIQLADIFPEAVQGAVLGEEVSGHDWSHGYPVIDASRLTQYLEDNPAAHPNNHKPWRRVLIVLNQNDGTEFTFDSDGDSYAEYLPASYHGAKSGNRFPPLVGPDSVLYFSNIYRCCGDTAGRIMGWNINDPGYLSVSYSHSPVAEPQALSGAGNMIYRNQCCDRVGDWYDLSNSAGRSGGILWSYNLDEMAPGYDTMWTILPGWPRLKGFYNGNSNSVNAAYHNHGDQNPIVPYQGRLFAHRSNAIFAFGPGAGPGALPLVTINPVQDSVNAPSEAQLVSRLETEIQKILEVGHLRPGYYSVAQFLYRGLGDYFNNPGDTLYTLALAYPHLSTGLQAQVRDYLQDEFQRYFDNEMYSTIGWDNGTARESMILPPEVEADLINHPPGTHPGPGWRWFYPQHNFYAMWKYVEIFPQEAQSAYTLAKNKLQVPIPDLPFADYFLEQPYELNAWIAGYLGFLELQELAGMEVQDSQLRSQVTDELDRLLQLRVSIFSKDSYWPDQNRFHKKHLDIARNFIFLVPELADYIAQNIPNQVQEALDEYDYIAPYWFVSRYESAIGEGVMSNLYNYSALFLAKAYILNESRSELTKYLDVPAFARGDLFYIQNLVAAIEASDSSSISELAMADIDMCPLLNYMKH